MPRKTTKKTTESKKVEKKTEEKEDAVQSKTATAPKVVKKAVAEYRNAATSPQKARLVADLIRGKDAAEALVILDMTTKKAAKLMKKTLVSAIANAEHDHSMDKDALVITRILVDDGIKFRRYRAVARGRGHGYVKRRAHILIELTEKK